MDNWNNQKVSSALPQQQEENNNNSNNNNSKDKDNDSNSAAIKNKSDGIETIAFVRKAKQ